MLCQVVLLHSAYFELLDVSIYEHFLFVKYLTPVIARFHSGNLCFMFGRRCKTRITRIKRVMTVLLVMIDDSMENVCGLLLNLLCLVVGVYLLKVNLRIVEHFFWLEKPCTLPGSVKAWVAHGTR